MADLTSELSDVFSAHNGLPADVSGELQSIMRLHSLSPQELFYKWESYSMKMGDETKLDLKSARDFKRDLQEVLERESRGKAAHMHSSAKKGIRATPRAGDGDVFGMCDESLAGFASIWLIVD